MYYAFGCGGGLIIAGLVTTKKLREQEGYVPLDYFAQRYGESKAIRLWAWISNVPSLLGIFIAQLLASGGILAADSRCCPAWPDIMSWMRPGFLFESAHLFWQMQF